MTEFRTLGCTDTRCHHYNMIMRFGTWVGERIHGNVVIGKDTRLAEITDMNAKDSHIDIGEGCDIAAGVVISTADSHLRCIGATQEIERKPIHIGDHVFIGTNAVILGGCNVEHHSVIGAGVVMKGAQIPPYSLIRAAAPVILSGHYQSKA